MQDNLHNEFEADDQLMDQAWTDMQQLLDKELPVALEKRKLSRYKYYLILFLFFLTSFGAGIGSVFMWQQNNEEAPAVIQAEVKTPIAATNQKESQSSGNIITDLSTDKTSKKNTQLKSVANKQKNNAQPDKQSAYVFSTPIFQPFNFLSELASNHSHTGSLIKLQQSIRNARIGLSDKAELLASNENQLNDPLAIETLVLENAFLDELSFDSKDKINDVINIPTNSKFNINWSWITGVHLEPSKGYGGYTTGLVSDIQIDSRFGLQAGLVFSRYQFNDIVLNDSPDALDLGQGGGSVPGVSNDVLGTPYVRGSGSSSKPQALGSASYLATPIFLTYRPFRKFRVNMGVEFGRMLQASVARLDGNSSSVDPNAKYSILDNNSSYGDQLNKNNFAAVFGFSYLHNDRFGFDFKYNHGFSDLSKQESQEVQQNDTRESVQFSVLYSFGKEK